MLANSLNINKPHEKMVQFFFRHVNFLVFDPLVLNGAFG